jgi:hypothetical protein
MTAQVRERRGVIRDEQDLATRAATDVAMVGLLVGLCAFFVSFAPTM